MDNYIDGVYNSAVLESFLRAKSILGRHIRIFVSISGGSDSDIVMDIIEKTKGDSKVEYVWFDTGIEYQATKDHLVFLEQKYGVEIKRIKAIKSIPTCCHEYGVPFLSKNVSEQIWRLQKHGFKFEDKPFDVLLAEYPKAASAVKWWCNQYAMKQFRIDYNKWLKEFLIANPPSFKIAPKCCMYAKKKVAKQFIKDFGADLNVYGVRRSEGGIRAAAYKTCFSQNNDGCDHYRPVFFYTDEDKRYYEEKFDITHSDCYTRYGLKRTGCVGCPYGRNTLNELEVIKHFEPKLYKACMSIFGVAYEYTKKYRDFCAAMNEKEKADEDQMSLFDMYYDFTG